MHNYVLTKFWHNKEYRDKFVDGYLRFSSMTEYTQLFEERKLIQLAAMGDINAEGKLRQCRSNQTDPFEGTIGTIDLGEKTIEDERMGKMLADPRLRAKGYDYSNLICFCKMNYTAESLGNGYSQLVWDEPHMNDFGQYGVIILDQQKFVRKISEAVSKKGYEYLAGSVSYHELILHGKKLKEAQRITHSICTEMFSLDEVSPSSAEYDAFDKWDKYKDEFEWRMLINRYPECIGELNTEPEDIYCGNLSKIVIPFEKSNIEERMNELFESGQIRPSVNKFYGNIGREEMRKKFYRMGNNQAYMVVTFGFNAEYF